MDVSVRGILRCITSFMIDVLQIPFAATFDQLSWICECLHIISALLKLNWPHWSHAQMVLDHGSKTDRLSTLCFFFCSWFILLRVVEVKRCALHVVYSCDIWMVTLFSNPPLCRWAAFQCSLLLAALPLWSSSPAPCLRCHCRQTALLLPEDEVIHMCQMPNNIGNS